MSDHIPHDSICITISEDSLPEHPNNFNGWSEEYAQLAVRKALKVLDYTPEVKFTKYACSNIDNGNNNSEACYIEVEQPGYFYIMRDMVNSINIIYNRWD